MEVVVEVACMVVVVGVVVVVEACMEQHMVHIRQRSVGIHSHMAQGLVLKR